jgi:hypothetical protein
MRLSPETADASTVFVTISQNNPIFFKNYPISCRSPWLTPLIAATQEAEIWRTQVRNPPGEIGETLSRKNLSQKKRLAEWLKQ